MGYFTDILLKHGPGSPGKTAKVLCDRFQSYYEGDYANNWKLNFSSLIYNRLLSNRSLPFKMQQESLYDTFPIDKLIEYCGGSLTLLIVMMMILETRQFRNTCHNSREAYSSAVVVIYNVVLQKCPYANPMALNNVQTKGYSFLMSVIDPYVF